MADFVWVTRAEDLRGALRDGRGALGAGVRAWLGPGEVARRGGVVHFDTEGLAARHVERRAPALTAVAMIQPAARGGGLRLWDVTYGGRDHATSDERARPKLDVEYAVGDVIVIDSYRL